MLKQKKNWTADQWCFSRFIFPLFGLVLVLIWEYNHLSWVCKDQSSIIIVTRIFLQLQQMHLF